MRPLSALLCVSLLLPLLLPACQGSPPADATVTPQADAVIDTILLEAPSTLTREPVAVFSFSASGVTEAGEPRFECRLDNGSWQGCTSPLTINILGEGTHAFAVRAFVGPLSDTTPATHSWRLDSIAPVLTWVQGPPVVTPQPTITVTFTSSEPAACWCTTDNTTEACDGEYSVTVLASGSHTLSVTAVDVAGNVSPGLSGAWILDLPPDTFLLDGPSGATAAQAAELSFFGIDDIGIDHFQCRLDGDSWGTCISPWSIPFLGIGEHSAEIRAVDSRQQGDPSPLTVTWTVTADPPPETSLLRFPAPLHPLTTAVVSAWSPDLDLDYFRCQIDNLPWGDCAEEQRLVALTPGAHTVRYAAVDTGGQIDPVSATASWEVVAPAATTWIEVAVGDDHACAIRGDATLHCWGNGGDGRLGTGSLNDATLPTAVTTDAFSQVAAGARHTCAIAADGRLFCWGWNAFGQVGNNSSGGAVSTPALIPGTWRQVALGSGYGCAVSSDATPWCWGANSSGELGRPGGAQDIPVRVADITEPVTAVTAGRAHACALALSGNIWCWGENSVGQLGFESDPTTTPAIVPLTMPADAVAAGGDHTCALAGSRLWCWGDGYSGETALGFERSDTSPTDTGLTTLVMLSAGGSHTCAIDAEQRLWCWGGNAAGQLGINWTADAPIGAPASTVPLEVGPEQPWRQVAAARFATCGLRQDQRLWCWGSNAALPWYVGGAIPVPAAHLH